MYKIEAWNGSGWQHDGRTYDAFEAAHDAAVSKMGLNPDREVVGISENELPRATAFGIPWRVLRVNTRRFATTHI